MPSPLAKLPTACALEPIFRYATQAELLGHRRPEDAVGMLEYPKNGLYEAVIAYDRNRVGRLNVTSLRPPETGDVRKLPEVDFTTMADRTLQPAFSKEMQNDAEEMPDRVEYGELPPAHLDHARVRGLT
jgi:hypothetical protein